MNQYIVGTLVTMTVTFRDANGSLVDPTTVTAEIRLPDQTVVDLTSGIAHPSTGVYSANYLTSQNGLHQYRFNGAGTVKAAQEGAFTAQTSFTS